MALDETTNLNINRKITNFMPEINRFDGDQSILDFFFQQIKELAVINNWPSQRSVAFLKSKLTGAALDFYIQSRTVQKCTSVDELHREFKSFFSNDSRQASILDLAKVQLLPAETIKSMAHRLEGIVHSVYRDIKDESSILSIKFNHFLQAVPGPMRAKLMEENVNDFHSAVKRAQQLQNIQSATSTSVSNQIHTPVNEFNEIHNKLASLQESINSIKIVSSEDKPHTHNDQFHTRVNQQSDSCNLGHRHFNSKRNSNPNNHRFTSSKFQSSRPRQNHLRFRQDSHFRHRQVCAFCGRTGHFMKFCFEFKKCNRGASSLNPNAKSYIPLN